MRRLQLRRRLAGVLLLVAFFLTGCSGGSTTASADGDSGAARYVYFYDDIDRDGTPQCFSAAIIIGVGTAMTVDDYGKLAYAIVDELNHASVLLVILDPVPHSPIKLYPKPFARALNRLVAQLQEPFSEDSTHCLQKNATIVVGGHSASGAGAFYGTNYFNFPVSGFLGLDPFPIHQRQQLSIPALFWGFAHTTCGVSVTHAAVAAYNQSMSGYRVLYQLQNNNHRPNLPSPPGDHQCHYAHCAFTDTGCRIVCPLQCSTDAANDLRRDVAISIRLFLRAISTSKDHGPFSHRDFAYNGFHLNPKENFQLITDAEVVKQDESDNHFDSLDRSLVPR